MIRQGTAVVEVMTEPIDARMVKDATIDGPVRLAQERLHAGAAWLKPMRSAALKRFSDIGFPTTKDEEWRFTNVAPIAKTAFAIAGESPIRLPAQQIRHFNFPGLACHQIVFVNGLFAPHLSLIFAGGRELPAGVKILPLAKVLELDRKLIEPHFARYAVEQQDAFTCLNSAFIEDGAFIVVPKGVELDQPIHLLNISIGNSGGSGAGDSGARNSGAGAIMTHPRNLIVADRDSRICIIEHYVSMDDATYLTNAVTDVVVGDNAHVEHYFIEQESPQAFNVSTLRVHQQRGSRCTSHSVLLGGKLVRNNVNAVLGGEGCDCLINGLYVGSDSQHMDNHMRVEHAQPHGDSRQFYKGILNDRSSAVFSGRIIVNPGAQKTDAKQTNKNLLLSDEAHVDTKPQLEIYADDVKCTHGATIGQLDDEAIFYLRARGLSLSAARSLLIHAFAGESLNRMSIEPVRNYLDTLLLARLPGGEILKQVLA